MLSKKQKKLAVDIYNAGIASKKDILLALLENKNISKWIKQLNNQEHIEIDDDICNRSDD